jgi:putative addiction module killer protein
MSSTGYNNESKQIFLIEETHVFSSWLSKLKNSTAKAAITRRIEQLEYGNAGDTKYYGDGLNAMRIHQGAGYRVYWFKTGNKVLLLACGGNKSSQQRDIARSRKIINAYRERNDNDYQDEPL